MQNNGWFVHVEWVVVLVTLLGGFYLLDGKIERQGERIDRNAEAQSARIDRNAEVQSARADQLYQMFIDLLKETKCPKS